MLERARMDATPFQSGRSNAMHEKLDSLSGDGPPLPGASKRKSPDDPVFLGKLGN